MPDCRNCGEAMEASSTGECPRCGYSESETERMQRVARPCPSATRSGPVLADHGAVVTQVHADGTPGAPAVEDGLPHMVAFRSGASLADRGGVIEHIAGSVGTVHHGDRNFTLNINLQGGSGAGGVGISPSDVERLSVAVTQAVRAVEAPDGDLPHEQQHSEAVDLYADASDIPPLLLYTAGRGIASLRPGLDSAPKCYLRTERSISTIAWRSAPDASARKLLLGYRYGFFEVDVAGEEPEVVRDHRLPEGFDLGLSHGFSGFVAATDEPGFYSSHRQFGIWHFPCESGIPHPMLPFDCTEAPEAGPHSLHLDWAGNLCFACGPEYVVCHPPYTKVGHRYAGDGSEIRAATALDVSRVRLAVTRAGNLLKWEAKSSTATSREGGYRSLAYIDMGAHTAIAAARPEAIDMLDLSLDVTYEIGGLGQMRRPHSMRVMGRYLFVLDDTAERSSSIFTIDLAERAVARIGDGQAFLRPSPQVFDICALPEVWL